LLCRQVSISENGKRNNRTGDLLHLYGPGPIDRLFMKHRNSLKKDLGQFNTIINPLKDNARRRLDFDSAM